MRHTAIGTAIVMNMMTIIIRTNTAIDTAIVSDTMTASIRTPTTTIGLAADSDFLVLASCSSSVIAAAGVMIDRRRAGAVARA